jgi:type VI secretion system secreted protein VgrG
VLVQLHWDRTGGSEADACWVHVAQMSSGAGWGGMFIPRVGTYVLVEFLDGDPDRPIVTGRVYNEVSPHPYELPLHKTRSALRTRSTPGGDGHNELRFEDRAGAEEVYLRAQRDLALDVGHDASRTVKHDDAVTVKGGRAVKVDGDVAVTVGGSETRAIGVAQGIAVGGARTLTVAGSRNEQVGLDDTLVVLGDRKAGIGGSETHEVTGDRVATVTGSESIAVSGSRTTTVGGADTTTVGGNRSTSVHGNSQEIVEGAVSSIVSMLSVAVGGATSIVGSGEIYIEAAGDGNVKIGEPNIYLASSSKIQLRSVEEIELVVGSLSDEDDWSAKITISRSGVKIDNGDVHGSFKDSTIKLNC